MEEIKYIGAVVHDASGTITIGGTAQTIIPANTEIRGFKIYNASSNPLWINDTGAAATTSSPSEQIPAGSYFNSILGGASILGISIVGATTGQSFMARWW